MKRCMLIGLCLCLFLCAFAQSASSDALPFVACSSVTVYSGGEALGTYPAGTLFRGLSRGKNTDVYVEAPDGVRGTADFSALLPAADYDCAAYPVFLADSVQSDGLKMYTEPSEKSSVTAVYPNGTALKIADYYCDEIYAYVVGPDRSAGFVRKAWLTWQDGLWPDPQWSRPAKEYLK